MRFFALIFASLILAPQASYACKPQANYQPPTVAQRAGDVMHSDIYKDFVGKVELIEAKKDENSPTIKMKFKVLTQFRGAPVEEIEVFAPGSTCGQYMLAVGQTDIITPIKVDGRWEIMGSPHGKDHAEPGLEEELNKLKDQTPKAAQ